MVLWLLQKGRIYRHLDTALGFTRDLVCACRVLCNSQSNVTDNNKRSMLSLILVITNGGTNHLLYWNPYCLSVYEQDYVNFFFCIIPLLYTDELYFLINLGFHKSYD